MNGPSADAEAKIIDAIYRGACDAGELTRALEMIRQYFGSPSTALGFADQLRPECQVAIGTGFMDEREMAYYGQHFAHLDPIPQALAALSPGTVAASDRIVPDSPNRTVFMNEFLRPRGGKEALACLLMRSEGRFGVFSVLQDAKRDPFEDDDIARLERLTPHLTRALQIRRLFLQSEARSKALESIVDRNETGMAGLSGDGPALFVNNAARAIAAMQDGLSLDRNGRPVAGDRGAAQRLAALQSDVARGGAGGLAQVPRPSSRRPYVVLVSPLPSGNDLFPVARGAVLFAIHDPERHTMPTEQRIVQLLQIPLGAAKVLQAILEGIELKDYADRAGISMNTVRFHLKSAFARTGARSQADLVRQAMLALNDLGPYFSDHEPR